jgi:RNA polymerase-binding transcription factor DksA
VSSWVPDEVPDSSSAEDAARLEQISRDLTGVENALRRLDDGSYGACDVCGAPLDAEALAGDPLLTRCRAHD